MSSLSRLLDNRDLILETINDVHQIDSPANRERCARHLRKLHELLTDVERQLAERTGDPLFGIEAIRAHSGGWS